MTGISYLHKIKICHLDLKPENIIVNTLKFEFKIVDFGFSSKEPFKDFLENIRGTPGYFPKNVSNHKIEYWLPKIDANDCIMENNSIPIVKNFKLVYGIDSYCLGRVLFFLKYIYDDNNYNWCFNCERSKGKKIDNIINDLVEPNCYKRILIEQALNKYFNF